ncbi:AAA family ATPase [Burkholderia cenocepacia]|uniref:AAA family ATPase n=1 Tax=Burkholderia cenocepacia TaxID=95486 RepID=UPI001C891567|nr:AAA family ATPase [Burkholderia cenocepacia]
MIKIKVKAGHKSIPRNIEFELPSFSIFTGKNGSGKSHLLEVISSTALSDVLIGNHNATNRVLIGYNGLNPQVDEQSDSMQVINSINNTWSQLSGVMTQYHQALKNGENFSDPLTQFFPRFNNPQLTSMARQILKHSGKKFDELTQNDVSENVRFSEISNGNIFFTQCALIFKAYHSRKVKNDIAEFRFKKHGDSKIRFLSDDDFIKKYGPPPWDLVNDVLARANLTYRVSNPEEGDFELPYRLRLVDKINNTEISVNDLSSGEKVLMSLALAIYNTQEGGDRPDLLLLDEPDAPLHPEFSKLLVETLKETIVEKAGVNVIISTHSPSTVAIAPDSCVFEIDRLSKVPHLVSNSQAVQILTSGIDFLRISYEKRRQIFVESKYDVEYFSRLFNILNRQHKFTYEPVFLEPHSGTSNCTDVIQIVKRLRSAGSDLVYGIIDFDLHNRSADFTFVLGEGSRYAIENYLLDPLYVCLSLIRHGKKRFADFGIGNEKNTYIDTVRLTQSDCQNIINAFIKLLGVDSCDLRPVTLENGYILEYPNEYLLHQGHDYEQKLTRAVPELNAIARGQGDSALKLGVLQVIEEFPQFLPVEVAGTLAKILEPAADQTAFQSPAMSAVNKAEATS